MAKMIIENARIMVQCSFTEGALARAIPGSQYVREQRCWMYPLLPHIPEMILKAFPGCEVVGELPKVNLAPDKTGQDRTRPDKALEPMPIKPNIKPFKHQINGYNLGITRPHVGLLFEQGCGKSLTAVAIVGRRFLRGQICRVLIVAPPSVVAVWPREFKDYADFPHEVVVLDQPGNAQRLKVLDHWTRADDVLQVAVINYEAFHTQREASPGSKKKISVMGDALAAWGPDCIICDESQRIKTPGSVQSKALHKLATFARYRIILTGTPVTQGPLDFWSQYRFLDPGIFGENFYQFRNKYAVMGGYYNKQVTAYKILPYLPDGRPNRHYDPTKEKEFFDKAYGCALRVTKADALDLPPYTDQVLYCNLEPKAAKAYKDMQAESVLELGNQEMLTATIVLTKLLRLSQITGGFVSYKEENAEALRMDTKVEQVSNAKLALLEETLQDLLEAGKKVVVFARFTPELHAIHKVAAKLSEKVGFIDGSVPMEQRGHEVEIFQKFPECKIFIAQTKTAGLGITLTAADTAIFYSLDYSFADYDQARARIHRIGQKNACTYIHLIARGTVDEKVMEALGTKRNVADLVVDNWRNLFTAGAR